MAAESVFKINGSYEAYFYVVLLQVSLIYLQRPDFDRNLSANGGKRPTASPVIEGYYLLTRFVGSALSWGSWVLAIYVWDKHGAAPALLFFLLGFGGSVAAMLIVPPSPRVNLIAHFISIPATIYLVHGTLLSLGIESRYL